MKWNIGFGNILYSMDMKVSRYAVTVRVLWLLDGVGGAVSLCDRIRGRSVEHRLKYCAHIIEYSNTVEQASRSGRFHTGQTVFSDYYFSLISR